jgi:hypothetical protein
LHQARSVRITGFRKLRPVELHVLVPGRGRGRLEERSEDIGYVPKGATP